jgi:hypothetical protein
MKTFGWAMAALLAGLVIGSWSLKADLRKAREQVRKLQDQVNRSGRKSPRVDGIVSMLNIPDAARQATSENRSRTGHSGSTTNGANHRNARPPWERHRRDPGSPGDDTPPSLKEQIDRAKDLWRVRSDLARDGFLTSVPETAEQKNQFDVLMAAMNLRLSNSIRTWVDVIKDEDTMSPEAGVKMMNDLSGAIVQVYDDLDRSMPADWREKTDHSFQPIDFVNPDVATPLMEIEPIMRTSQWERAESRRVEFEQTLPAGGSANPK